jgi:adenylate cyclase
MRYELISADGGRTFGLRGAAPLVVGRALTSDIPVFDATISRRHAELRCDESGVELRDLGSSNGTFLNGARITAGHASPGDVITFGNIAFRLREVAEPVEAGAPAPAAASNAGASNAGAPPSATIRRQLPVEAPRVGLTSAFRLGDPLGGEMTPPVEVGSFAPAQHRLSLLLEVATGLAGVVDVDALLDKIAGYCLEILDVDRVSILLVDEGGALSPKVARGRRGGDVSVPVPQSIARAALDERVAILSDNAPEDRRFGGESIVRQRVQSTMCVPLVGRESRALGLLYVDNVTATHRFGDADLELLVAFAGIAAVAIENGQLAERSRREAMVRSNFERYFAPALAARIAGEPGAATLGGEKRRVAVLFSDLRGFTALSEAMRPDEMAALLSEYFTEMVECVFRHGGTLDKFIGDAVMAQWGAPIGEPDDPDRAVRAAIDMVTALDALNAKWRAEGRPELHVGIGLNYGEAFAGNIGSERRLEFTVIGDTVNTASRLCSAAGAGEILVSDELRRALTTPFPLDECEPLALRGKSSPVPVYRVSR